MSLSSAKIIATYYDEACEQLNKNTMLSKKVKVDTVEMGTQQNANDVYHRIVEQQSPLIKGRDLTGKETGIIEQSVPYRINEPQGDFFQLNTSNLRDKGFWERRARASVAKMNTSLEADIMDEIANKSAIYYETASPDFDIVAEADTIFTERQLYDGDGRSFLIDPRANQASAGNLASRSMYPNNISEEARRTGLIGNEVAGFDLFRNPYARSITGNVAAASTTTADLEFKPEGAGTTAEGTPYNVDFRVAVIPVVASANYNVGDVVTLGANATTMNDKQDTGRLMTFRVVGKPDGTSLSIYPKPIAWDQRPVADGGTGVLTAEEAAYANISTTVSSGTTVAIVNSTAGTFRTSSFFADDAICVVNGSEPIELLQEFDGMKVEKTTLDNGVDLYLAYDANLATLNCRVRLFTRYGVVLEDPSRAGNVRYTG